MPKEVAEAIRKINAIDEEYTLNDLIESELTTEQKILALYESGKGYNFGQSSTWTGAIERMLEIIGIEVEGVNA